MEEIAARPKQYEQLQYALTDQLLKDFGVWALDSVHNLPPRTPLTTRLWVEYVGHGFEYAAEMLSIPVSKGTIWAIMDGKNYISTILAKPEEIPEREKLFRERMTPLLDNYKEMWEKEKEKLIELFRPFKEVDVKKLSNIELKLLFLQMREVWRIHWESHMYWYDFGALFYDIFEQLCAELLGLDYLNPLFVKLVSGNLSMIDKVTAEMWGLAAKARELGLTDLFLTTKNAEEILAKLEKSEAGRKWLEGFGEFIKTHGWRCENMHDCGTPTWFEKPSLAIPTIVQALAKGGTNPKEKEIAQRIREREKAKKEVLAKIPTGQRDWFEKLMEVSLFFNFWNEDHTYYEEFPLHSTTRKLVNEIGERMAEAGAIDDPSDIHFLMPDDILMAIIPMKNINMRAIVKANREEYQRCLTMVPTFIVGDASRIEELNIDPVPRIATRQPRVRPEIKTDLQGAASSPGVVEGIARVVMSDTQINEIQPGDILVTLNTTAVWVPVFSIIKGLVTDGGGELSHSAIVAREYGIPAVVGTQQATQKIKTGDRIRVDGDLNAVFILA